MNSVSIAFAGLLGALNVLGMIQWTSMIGAALYLFIMIFYFVAGRRLAKQLGVGNQTAKRITVCRRNGGEREQWCVFVPPHLLYSNILSPSHLPLSSRS